MLDAPAYLLGAATLLVSIWALALGAARVRSRLLAGWSGLPARLADAVIALALLILIAELVGTVGMLERIPLAAACVAVGLGFESPFDRRGRQGNRRRRPSREAGPALLRLRSRRS